MQTNNTTLTKRQKHIISSALTREHERATDAMRILYQANTPSEARATSTTALLHLTDEITTLINLINNDQENPNA